MVRFERRRCRGEEECDLEVEGERVLVKEEVKKWTGGKSRGFF